MSAYGRKLPLARNLLDCPVTAQSGLRRIADTGHTMETARLQRWASFAELVGTGAVVVSLLFVAYSINRNTKELQAANENFLYGIQEARRGDEATNPQLAGLVIKAQDGESLTPSERRQYFSHIVRGLNVWEMAYKRYQDGLLPEERWAGWDNMYADQARRDFPYEWWLEVRSWYADDFATHVDSAYARD